MQVDTLYHFLAATTELSLAGGSKLPNAIGRSTSHSGRSARGQDDGRFREPEREEGGLLDEWATPVVPAMRARGEAEDKAGVLDLNQTPAAVPFEDAVYALVSAARTEAL